MVRNLNKIVNKTSNTVSSMIGIKPEDEPDRASVRDELMHISEDTQVPPDWVSEWK